MLLEHYIAELLYRYDCVVVPGFGAFLAQTRSSLLNAETRTLHPPSKTLSFNGQLASNDGLLVSYMANAEKISYEAMQEKVVSLVTEWKNFLKDNNRLKLSQIGELWLNPDGKILFQPSRTTNFLTTSFGLSPLPITPAIREVIKDEVSDLEAKAPLVFTPEKRQEINFRPFIKYAAVLLLAFATGLTGYRSYLRVQNNRQLAVQEAQEQVSKRIQEATFFNNEPMELPPLSLDVALEKPVVGRHHVIAGAFRFRENADKKILQLKKLGFKASYLGTNPFGLHMVAYSSHENPQEALSALRNVRRTHSPDAWLKSVR